MTLGAIALVGFMAWSLWSLTRSPLNPVQRLWWVLAVLILPGIGSLAWWWWIRRHYPRRKAQDPDWDPSVSKSTRAQQGRPRPSRARYKQVEE
ncbi:MAG TPA: hypothetical protein H9822_07185 [Candidatus Yaniella excrementavium]|nr:hypothetical protein [Candidatus Yaniella excrementavium]